MFTVGVFRSLFRVFPLAETKSIHVTNVQTKRPRLLKHTQPSWEMCWVTGSCAMGSQRHRRRLKQRNGVSKRCKACTARTRNGVRAWAGASFGGLSARPARASVPTCCTPTKGADGTAQSKVGGNLVCGWALAGCLAARLTHCIAACRHAGLLAILVLVNKTHPFYSRLAPGIRQQKLLSSP